MHRAFCFRFGITCVAAALLVAGAAGADDGAARIRREALMKTVERLAAPDLHGRLAGSPGYLRAAREMAERFRAAGLTPAGEDGWFQKLAVEYEEIRDARLAIAGADGRERALRLGPDFTCRGLTGSGDFDAPVVFAGYGMSEPAQGYDDYAGLDARGKVVLVLKEPPPFTVDSAGWGEAASMRGKGLTAAAHGAVALLLVSRPDQPHPQRPIASMLEGEARQDERFPRLQVDGPVAAALFAPGAPGLLERATLIDSTHAPSSQALPGRARGRVRARYDPARPTVNVVAMLPGSDSTVARECVVIGAHLDHVGEQAGRIYFPGANDNASGAAAVVAVAEAMARAGAPRRTVIFALFTSEEAGLYGAKRFVERPPVPRDRLVAYLNLDCVGHGDSIGVGGRKDFPELWARARALDRAGASLMVEESGGGGGADAAPFFRAGIPTLYFDSVFSYTHLHLTSDTPATLNPALLEAIARLAYRTTWSLAQDGLPPRAAAAGGGS